VNLGHLAQVGEYLDNTSEFLTEYKTEEREVKELLDKATLYSDTFSMKEKLLLKILFDEKLMEFKKNEKK
jgi:hypothetical protein